MDKELLVTAGHEILSQLEKKGFSAGAAMWIHNTDVDTWKLLVVPAEKKFKDQRKFYRLVAEIIGASPDAFHGMDASFTKLTEATHPAIASLSKLFRVENKSSIFLQNNKLNDFFLADGIVLLMKL